MGYDEYMTVGVDDDNSNSGLKRNDGIFPQEKDTGVIIWREV
jgi:hypothetical protein